MKLFMIDRDTIFAPAGIHLLVVREIYFNKFTYNDTFTNLKTNMISCKAAVKAGDKLTPEEINDLLEHRDYCQDAHHCPHGRPTALVFSREELDKRFKRI